MSKAVTVSRDRQDMDEEFAPDELAMLRSFFRDEAQEALDAITRALLDTGPLAPSGGDVTELMRITHTLKGSAGTVGLSEMVGFTHELEEQFARLRTGTLEWSTIVHERFIEVVDAIRGYVDAVGTSAESAVSSQPIAAQFDALRRTGTWKPATPLTPAAPVAPAFPRPAGRGKRRNKPPTEPPLFDTADEHLDDTTRSIVADTGTDDTRADSRSDDRGVLRVDPKRIDILMDSVGELVVDRTRIERRVNTVRTITRELENSHEALQVSTLAVRELGEHNRELGAIASAMDAISARITSSLLELQRATANLLDDADALNRTSATLQNGLIRVRMSSAKALFQTLGRQLRTTARRANKKIRLLASGEDTEFDKTVVERITDPLIQLVRNAVAHGIESADERIAAGKSPIGELRILARQEGNLVVLQLSDDGAGIDPDALRERFVAAGRWSRQKAELSSDEEVLHAIFDAGVSTRDEADPLAGHGVGLDATRDTIARLGGEIRMTSTPGKGTSFTIRLPVSTAVSHAMLFKLYRDVYAIPQLHVVETAQVDCWDEQFPTHLEVREGQIPLLHLQQLLNARSPVEMPTLPVIVVAYAGRQFALTCDKVVGPRDIVVKDLGPLLSPLPLYSGATLSGSGKVQLILDVAALTRLAYPDMQSDTEPDDEQLATTFDSEDSVSVVFHRALVAEDSRSIREAVSRILVDAGYIVDAAEDGARAWHLLSEGRYDLVVTDIEMPELDGFELIERMRRDRRLADKPVVVMTSRTHPADRQRARDLAVRSFIAKPVTRRKIFEALKAV